MRSLALLLLLAATAAAEIRTKTIEYRDGPTLLEGFMAWNDSMSSRRPGVLIVHQWMGLGEFEQEKAKEIAALGYVAFAVDIYGKGVRPKTPDEARKLSSKYKGDRLLYRRRLQVALRQLLVSEHVDFKRVGAIGFCFGGTGVLELARSGAPIQGVVSFHGGLATPTPQDAKNIKAKVLVLHGADDPHVPEKEVLAFMKEMRDAKVVDWQFVAYGGAVHAFTDPRADRETAKYHPAAARRSREAMRIFFKEAFE